jgi:glutaredoxin-related protein
MGLIDRVRARAHAAVEKAPGRVGDALRKANEALGRPLADEGELEDRRAFAAKAGTSTSPSSPSTATARPAQAPVILYFVDRKEQSREVKKLTDILDANGVVYKVTDITEDPAAQYAVKRDSNGLRLPVVFVAGECLGGREQVVNAASSGELKKKVFG